MPRRPLRPPTRPPAAPGPSEILVEITGLAPGGDAVGRQVGGADDGRVTFVPYAAPGERVQVQLVRSKARVAWGEMLGIASAPSAARVTPPCPLFGSCGGCQWQHVDQGIQRSAKGDIVARALGVSLGEASPVGPAYGYRERTRLAVATEANVDGSAPADAGPVRVGYRARRSHEVLDVATCPLLAPTLDAALPVVRARAGQVPPGTEFHLLLGQGGGRELVAGAAGGRGFVINAQSGGGLALKDVAPSDRSHWPDVSEAGGPPLAIPPEGFAQVSRAGNAALVRAVLEAVGPKPGRVLELFAGSGNFTRHLVRHADEVIASDGDLGAVARGRLNVPEATWKDAAALNPTVLPADTVVVDPPREGLDDHSLALAAAAQRLVYVSCDPQTLSRDRGLLLRRGMRLVGAQAFDLMPQTHHVEVVALFERR
ncbi:MAG TPA: TRAM domain-containing protein [Polyangia bacterium]